MLRHYELPFALIVLSTGWARGEIASGPAVGEKPPALNVLTVTGAEQGKELDYVTARKEAATIFVFILADQWDRPMARFLKKLDSDVKDVGTDSQVVAVWLTEDHDKTKEYLPRAQMSLQLEHTALAIFPGAKAGPEPWAINPDARLTAVVVRGPKVAATFGYQSINETVVPEVLAALRAALDRRQ